MLSLSTLPFVSTLYFVCAERRLGHVPVPPSLLNTWYNSAAGDILHGMAIEFTEDTKDDWEVKPESPSWDVKEIMQYFYWLNWIRGSRSCHKQRECRYSALKLSEQ